MFTVLSSDNNLAKILMIFIMHHYLDDSLSVKYNPYKSYQFYDVIFIHILFNYFVFSRNYK